ncbi:unnamed protein product [Amoebophrya sp. A25]|nr:unnamed protein product [Amoebophrya sp. A25]|eukprot:GSA25T00013929001.1
MQGSIIPRSSGPLQYASQQEASGSSSRRVFVDGGETYESPESSLEYSNSRSPLPKRHSTRREDGVSTLDIQVLSCSSGSYRRSNGKSASTKKWSRSKLGKEHYAQKLVERSYHGWLLAVVRTYDSLCQVAASRRERILHELWMRWKEAYAQQTAEVLADAQRTFALQQRMLKQWSDEIERMRRTRLQERLRDREHKQVVMIPDSAKMSIDSPGHAHDLDNAALSQHKSSTGPRPLSADQKVAPAKDDTRNARVAVPSARKSLEERLRESTDSLLAKYDLIEPVPKHENNCNAEVQEGKKVEKNFTCASLSVSASSIAKSSTESRQSSVRCLSVPLSDLSPFLRASAVSNSATLFDLSASSVLFRDADADALAVVSDRESAKSLLESVYRSSLEWAKSSANAALTLDSREGGSNLDNLHVNSTTEAATKSRSAAFSARVGRLQSLLSSAVEQLPAPQQRQKLVFSAEDGTPMVNVRCLETILQSAGDEAGGPRVNTAGAGDNCIPKRDAADATRTRRAEVAGGDGLGGAYKCSASSASSLTFSVDGSLHLAGDISRWRNYAVSPLPQIQEERNEAPELEEGRRKYGEDDRESGVDAAKEKAESNNLNEDGGFGKQIRSVLETTRRNIELLRQRRVVESPSGLASLSVPPPLVQHNVANTATSSATGTGPDICNYAHESTLLSDKVNSKGASVLVEKDDEESASADVGNVEERRRRADDALHVERSPNCGLIGSPSCPDVSDAEELLGKNHREAISSRTAVPELSSSPAPALHERLLIRHDATGDAPSEAVPDADSTPVSQPSSPRSDTAGSLQRESRKSLLAESNSERDEEQPVSDPRVKRTKEDHVNAGNELAEHVADATDGDTGPTSQTALLSSPTKVILENESANMIGTARSEERLMLLEHLVDMYRAEFAKKSFYRWARNAKTLRRARERLSTAKCPPDVVEVVANNRLHQVESRRRQSREPTPTDEMRIAAVKERTRRIVVKALRLVFRRWSRVVQDVRSRDKSLLGAARCVRLRRFFHRWHAVAESAAALRSVLLERQMLRDARLRDRVALSWRELTLRRRKTRDRGVWWSARRRKRLARQLLIRWAESAEIAIWHREVVATVCEMRFRRLLTFWRDYAARKNTQRSLLEEHDAVRRFQLVRRVMDAWQRRLHIRRLCVTALDQSHKARLRRSLDRWLRFTFVGARLRHKDAHRRKNLLVTSVARWQQFATAFRTAEEHGRMRNTKLAVRSLRIWCRYAVSAIALRRAAFTVFAAQMRCEISSSRRLREAEKIWWRKHNKLSFKRCVEAWKIAWFGILLSAPKPCLADEGHAAETAIQLHGGNSSHSALISQSRVATCKHEDGFLSETSSKVNISTRRLPRRYKHMLLRKYFAKFWAAPLLLSRQRASTCFLRPFFRRWKRRQAVKQRVFLAWCLHLTDIARDRLRRSFVFVHWRWASRNARKLYSSTDAITPLSEEPRRKFDRRRGVIDSSAFAAVALQRSVLFEPYRSMQEQAAITDGQTPLLLFRQAEFLPDEPETSAIDPMHYPESNPIDSALCHQRFSADGHIADRAAGDNAITGIAGIERYGDDKKSVLQIDGVNHDRRGCWHQEELQSDNRGSGGPSALAQSHLFLAARALSEDCASVVVRGDFSAPPSSRHHSACCEQEPKDGAQSRMSAAKGLRYSKRRDDRLVASSFVHWREDVAERKRKLAAFLQRREHQERESRLARVEKKARLVAHFRARRRRLKEIYFRDVWRDAYIRGYKARTQLADNFASSTLRLGVLKRFFRCVWKELFIERWKTWKHTIKDFAIRRRERFLVSSVAVWRHHVVDAKEFRTSAAEKTATICLQQLGHAFWEFRTRVADKQRARCCENSAADFRMARLADKSIRGFTSNVDFMRRCAEADSRFEAKSNALMQRCLIDGFQFYVEKRQRCRRAATVLQASHKQRVLSFCLLSGWRVHFGFRRKVQESNLRRQAYWFALFRRQAAHSRSGRAFLVRWNRKRKLSAFRALAFYRMGVHFGKKIFFAFWRDLVAEQRRRARVALEFAQAVAHAENLRRRRQTRLLSSCLLGWSRDSFLLWHTRRLVHTLTRFPLRLGFCALATRPKILGAARLAGVVRRILLGVAWSRLYANGVCVAFARQRKLRDERSVLRAWRHVLCTEIGATTALVRSLHRCILALSLRRMRASATFFAEADAVASLLTNSRHLSHVFQRMWKPHFLRERRLRPAFDFWRKYVVYREQKRKISLLLFFQRARERQAYLFQRRLRSDLARGMYRRSCMRKCLLVWGSCRRSIVDVRQSSDVWDRTRPLQLTPRRSVGEGAKTSVPATSSTVSSDVVRRRTETNPRTSPRGVSEKPKVAVAGPAPDEDDGLSPKPIESKAVRLQRREADQRADQQRFRSSASVSYFDALLTRSINTVMGNHACRSSNQAEERQHHAFPTSSDRARKSTRASIVEFVRDPTESSQVAKKNIATKLDSRLVTEPIFTVESSTAPPTTSLAAVFETPAVCGAPDAPTGNEGLLRPAALKATSSSADECFRIFRTATPPSGSLHNQDSSTPSMSPDVGSSASMLDLSLSSFTSINDFAPSLLQYRPKVRRIPLAGDPAASCMSGASGSKSASPSSSTAVTPVLSSPATFGSFRLASPPVAPSEPSFDPSASLQLRNSRSLPSTTTTVLKEQGDTSMNLDAISATLGRQRAGTKNEMSLPASPIGEAVSGENAGAQLDRRKDGRTASGSSSRSCALELHSRTSGAFTLLEEAQVSQPTLPGDSFAGGSSLDLSLTFCESKESLVFRDGGAPAVGSTTSTSCVGEHQMREKHTVRRSCSPAQEAPQEPHIEDERLLISSVDGTIPSLASPVIGSDQPPHQSRNFTPGQGQKKRGANPFLKSPTLLAAPDLRASCTSLASVLSSSLASSTISGVKTGLGSADFPDLLRSSPEKALLGSGHVAGSAMQDEKTSLLRKSQLWDQVQERQGSPLHTEMEGNMSRRETSRGNSLLNSSLQDISSLRKSLRPKPAEDGRSPSYGSSSPSQKDRSETAQQTACSSRRADQGSRENAVSSVAVTAVSSNKESSLSLNVRSGTASGAVSSGADGLPGSNQSIQRVTATGSNYDPNLLRDTSSAPDARPGSSPATVRAVDQEQAPTLVAHAPRSTSPRMARSTRRKRNKYYDFARKRRNFFSSSCDSIREEEEDEEDETVGSIDNFSRRSSFSPAGALYRSSWNPRGSSVFNNKIPPGMNQQQAEKKDSTVTPSHIACEHQSDSDVGRRDGSVTDTGGGSSTPIDSTGLGQQKPPTAGGTQDSGSSPDDGTLARSSSSTPVSQPGSVCARDGPLPRSNTTGSMASGRPVAKKFLSRKQDTPRPRDPNSSGSSTGMSGAMESRDSLRILLEAERKKSYLGLATSSPASSLLSPASQLMSPPTTGHSSSSEPVPTTAEVNDVVVKRSEVSLPRAAPGNEEFQQSTEEVEQQDQHKQPPFSDTALRKEDGRGASSSSKRPHHVPFSHDPQGSDASPSVVVVDEIRSLSCSFQSRGRYERDAGACADESEDSVEVETDKRLKEVAEAEATSDVISTRDVDMTLASVGASANVRVVSPLDKNSALQVNSVEDISTRSSNSPRGNEKPASSKDDEQETQAAGLPGVESDAGGFCNSVAELDLQAEHETEDDDSVLMDCDE